MIKPDIIKKINLRNFSTLYKCTRKSLEISLFNQKLIAALKIKGKKLKKNQMPGQVCTTEETSIVPGPNGNLCKVTKYTTKTTYPDGSWNTKWETKTTPVDSNSSSANDTNGNIIENNVNSESDGEFSQWENDALRAHNNYRSRHGVHPLKLDKKVTEFSQSWANTLGSWGKMQHSSGSGYGENIYWASSGSNGVDATDSWYSEIKDFNFNGGGFASSTGHFTQVVWKNSTKLGIAKCEGSNGTYIVANYDPPGNFQGQFQENVPHLL